MIDFDFSLLKKFRIELFNLDIMHLRDVNFCMN